jgi:AraC-like DNA-binding protein
MDALSSILKASRLEAMFCSQHTFRGDWGFNVVQTANAQFWRVSKGACSVGLPGGPAVDLQTGDIVLIPHGAPHWVANKQSTPITNFEQHFETQAARVDGEETTVAAGYFGFDDQQQHPFIKDLPPLLHISSYGIKNQHFLEHICYLMVTELDGDKPGSQIMLKGLAEMLFISIIRTYLQQQAPEKGFISALADPQISQALELMHQRPSEDWTVETLGKQVGMSRTLFFNRFKFLVGETPVAYLTNWRINRAKEMLASGMERVDVAERVGYQSEAAFNRVFKMKTGVTPGRYRAAKLSV